MDSVDPVPDLTPAPPTRLPAALAPFRAPQYRILALSLVLSLFGLGVWLVTLPFQVERLGGGPTDLSLIAAIGAAGMLVFVLIAGAVADRIPQKLVLVTIETVKSFAAAGIAVLALTGALELWHLAALALVFAIGDAFFFPAYSAMLPSVLPPEQLLAANGFEGMLRPSIMQAAGPAIGAIVVGAFSPGAAFLLFAISQALAAVALGFLRTTPVRREFSEEEQGAHPLAGAMSDIAEGFRYMVRTPWLLSTLLFACLLILLIMGPIEVLLPFLVDEQTGLGEAGFAAALAAFGAGGALGSLAVASLRLPRRYLTVMILGWGLGCLPMAGLGFTDQLWVIIVLLFVTGAFFSGAQVIWGTLLQRRVPPALLGRVSSLDFFVSLLLMPVSMALAGPVGEWIGFPPVFLVAGVIPTLLAVLALWLPRLDRDELAHPLDSAPPAESEAEPAAPEDASRD